MDPAQLPLRDVHLPPSPSWWPPAPGWWWLGAALLLVAVAWAGWRVWRHRRRRRWLRGFDAECSGAPEAQLAAVSAMLRRAARRASPGTELLEGQAWLRFLDGRGQAFSAGPGRLLLDGAFRPTVAAAELDAARALARARFLELMERRR